MNAEQKQAVAEFVKCGSDLVNELLDTNKELHEKLAAALAANEKQGSDNGSGFTEEQIRECVDHLVEVGYMRKSAADETVQEMVENQTGLLDMLKAAAEKAKGRVPSLGKSVIDDSEKTGSADTDGGKTVLQGQKDSDRLWEERKARRRRRH